MRWVKLLPDLALIIGLVTLGHDVFAQAAQAPILDHPDLRFQVDVAPAEVVVGRPVTVSFHISYAPGTKTYFPQSPGVKPFVLVAHERDESTLTGGAAGEIQQLKLLPVRTGTSVLAPIEVPYLTPSGEARVALTPEVRIQSADTLGNEADPSPAPAGVPVVVLVRNTVLIWVLAGLGIAVIAGLGGVVVASAIRRYRDAHRPLPPPRPADEVALERLAQIEAMGLVEAGDYQKLALLVSEVAREFLGNMYGFQGVDMTSWEVLQALKDRDLRRADPLEIDDFLSLCDLVKFAKFEPTADEARGLLRRARDLVERVCMAPAPAPAPDPDPIADVLPSGEDNHAV